MGNAVPDSEDGSTFDLFDRWLAHRDEQAGTTGTDKAADEAADEAAEAEAPVPEPVPEPLPEEPAVDPLFDAAFVDTIALADEPAPLAPDEHPDLMPLAASEPVAVLEVPSPPDPEPEPEPEPPARTDNVAVGRAILAALATPAQTVPDETPVPAPVSEPVSTPVPVPVAAAPAPARATKPPKARKPAKPPKAPRVAKEPKAPKAPKAPKEPRTPRAAKAPAAPEQVPHIIDFAPRVGTRRLVGLLLLVALAATAATGYAAYQDRATTMIGVAATLGVLTAILWAIWAGSVVTTLSVRGGQLEIIRAGSRHRFDLASDYTPIEIVGEPGSRKWKVLFHRKSMAPFVVDASMVDPVEFSRVVRHYRPGA